MRLIDVNEALRKVEQIPFIVNENKAFHEGCRYMQKKVLMVLHESKAIEAEPVKHGKWRKDKVKGDGYKHHYCTNCEVDALFEYQESPDFDEGIDGEMEYIGMRDYDIIEHITKYCPNCGAKMDLEG